MKTKISRFMKNIIFRPKTRCWIWTGLVDKDGYSRFSMWRGHRYSYSIFNGPIGKSVLVCHSCDNTTCVNPEHLWLGSQADNIADRDKKNRQAKGNRLRPERRHLEVKEALKIREEMLVWLTYRKAAEKYNISIGMVANIKHARSWHFSEL